MGYGSSLQHVTNRSDKKDIATTQLNSTQSWVGLIFLRKPQTTKPHHTTNHKPKPSVTFSQLLSNQTWPNSYSLISTQLEDSCKKLGSPKTNELYPTKQTYWIWFNSEFNIWKIKSGVAQLNVTLLPVPVGIGVNEDHTDLMQLQEILYLGKLNQGRVCTCKLSTSKVSNYWAI